MNKEQIRQYFVAAIVSLIILGALSGYLFLRRGYYDLYIANKAMAGASLVVLGIVLLIGPLSRLYQRFDSWVIYRKELGIAAFFWALAHSLISLFFLPDRFPLEAFFRGKQLVTSSLGVAGIVLLAILFIISFERLIAKFDRQKWWKWQYTGVRLAGILIFLHVAVMKYQGWFSWFLKGGSEELARPFFPPGSFIVGTFGLFVVLIRLGEFLFPRIAKDLVPLLFILLLVIWGGSFAWGISKTPKALPLQWKTCLNLPKSIVMEGYPAVCVSPDGRRTLQTL